MRVIKSDPDPNRLIATALPLRSCGFATVAGVNETVDELIDQCGENFQREPRHVGGHDFGCRTASELDLSGCHGLHNSRSAGDVNDLNVEARLIEQTDLFGEVMNLLA
jgi:hypothetical protein